MRRLRHNSICQLATRSGFTLVEMLVATALVILIMLMFAQIYGTAAGTMTDARALSKNDQKARTLSSIIRSDLQRMTYRQPSSAYGDVRGIVPMVAGDEPIIDPANQRGYFYFSENDPFDSTDDVLQFTMVIRSGQRGDAVRKSQERPFIGKAGNLGNNVLNQPELDDGRVPPALTLDGRGQSRAVEVVYFLRNGNLYRRQLLLRDPISAAPPLDPQPTFFSGNRVFNTSTPQWTNASDPKQSFWEVFDYAAIPINGVLTFHSLESLSNVSGVANNPLAIPQNRFGFDLTFGGRSGGYPREYFGVPGGVQSFMGRLTLDESTKWWDTNGDNVYDQPALAYPGRFIGNQQNIYNPFLWSTDLADRDRDGSIDKFSALQNANPDDNFPISRYGARQGEDILLANVESFDVEFLDDVAGGFFDLGYPRLRRDSSNAAIPPGRFDHWQNKNFQFGRFIGTGAFTGNDNQPGDRGTDDDNDGNSDNGFVVRTINNTDVTPNVDGTIIEVREGGWPGTDDQINRIFDTWHPNAAVGLASNSNLRLPPYRPVRQDDWSRFVSWPNVTAVTDLIIPPAIRTSASPGIVPPIPSMYYRVVQAGAAGSIEPEWPAVPGNIVEDGSRIWQCVDNRIGLEAIRITVRFKDVGSGQPRQVSIVHSFVE